MASPECPRTGLARGISEIDLNNALHKVQSETGLRYTTEDLLSMRPKNEKHNAEHNVVEIGSPLPEGVMTPPDRVCPNPPPPTPVALVNGSNNANGDEPAKCASNGVSDTSLSQLPNGDAPKKKKKKSKSAGLNKKNAGSGFEEFYADTPQTPEEYDEECDIYHETIPFASRIQTCIQRYRGRRKLDEFRSNIITKYLMLGGVEATNKAFTGGLDQDTLDNATAAEIAEVTATDFVRTGTTNAKYYDGSEGWVVDFEGVAKGFFSYRLINMFPIDDQKDIELYTSTIRNFLNYVLHHRVCEEYTSDVLAARKVCSLAEKELWAIKQLEKKLPGDFNIAASTLHGGRYENLHMGTAPWAVESPEYQEYAAADQGLEVRDAEMIFKTAIAFAGDDDMFIEAMKADIHIVKTTTRCFEVAGIERPDLLTASQYKSVPHVRGIKALGVLKLKHWEGPKIIPEDFTDDEDDQTNKSDAIESFWLEDDILQLCYIGLKMEIEVHELNIGVKFFDRLHGLYCSFFVALPNEKMLGYKESVLNTRPAPSEDDPEVEERFLEEEAQKELEADEKLMADTK